MNEIGTTLAAARRGDRRALNSLLVESRVRLCRVAHARRGSLLTRCVHTSDLVQATYLDALRSVSRFRGSTQRSFDAWLVTILENNVRDAVKFHTAGRRSRLAERPMTQPTETELPDRGPPTFQELESAEELHRFAEALGRLPVRYRAVLLARLAEQARAEPPRAQSGKERMLLARARAALALELEAHRAPGPP